MRGVGRASAAITIVNALPTGVGCALGIGLYATAEVTLRPQASDRSNTVRIPESSRTPLVESALRGALGHYGMARGIEADLSLRSEIPPSRGLKSSSAVASAIALAVARASGKSPDPLETALLSADVSRVAGVSATGALDDALAGLSGDFVVTDNSRGKVLRTGPADPDWEVALLVPRGTHRPSPKWKKEFEAHAKEGRAAVEAALARDWWQAMALNTELVERTMHYEYASVREGLQRRGALGSGVSGLGPALVAVAPRREIRGLLEALPAALGERRSVPLSAAALEYAGGSA
jgi:shikimate kinase